MSVSSKNKTLLAVNSLTALAMALPGLKPAQAETQQITNPKSTFHYTRLDEGRHRYKIDIYQALLEMLLTKNIDVSLKVGRDVMSGASSIFYWPASIESATGSVSSLKEFRSGASIADHRNEAILTARYFGDEKIVSVHGYLSEEDDYTSGKFGGNYTHQFNKKSTEVSLGYSFTNNKIRPTNTSNAFVPNRKVKAHNNTNNANITIKQDLSDKNYISQNFEFSYDKGYLADPYKGVFVYGNATHLEPIGALYSPFLPGAINPFVGFTILHDKRPKNKRSYISYTKFVQYLATFDSALHLDYRFIYNTWNIKSHTASFTYIQPAFETWEFSGSLRYYAQTKARFYSMAFTALPAPPFKAKKIHKNHHSSDYRLANFGSLTYELGVSTKFMANKSGTVRLVGGAIQRHNSLYLAKKHKPKNPSNNFNSYYLTIELKFDF